MLPAPPSASAAAAECRLPLGGPLYLPQVGPSTFEAWQAAHPQDWLATKGKWEVEKRLWDPAAAVSGEALPSYVPIPVSLHGMISVEDKMVLRCAAGCGGCACA